MRAAFGLHKICDLPYGWELYWERINRSPWLRRRGRSTLLRPHEVHASKERPVLYSALLRQERRSVETEALEHGAYVALKNARVMFEIDPARAHATVEVRSGGRYA